MWRVVQRDSQQLCFLKREGCFSQAFFSIFLSAGLIVLGGLFVIGIPKMIQHPPDHWWEPLLLLLPLVVGGSFALIGAWGVAGREGIDFDRSSSRAIQWSGLFRPLWRTEFDLKGFRQVLVGAPIRCGGAKTRHWEYPVVVLGADGVRLEMDLMTPEEAEAFAQEIGEFLGLKVSDEPV